MDDDYRCMNTDPNSEWECPHNCMMPKGHDGNHMVLFEWPQEERTRWP